MMMNSSLVPLGHQEGINTSCKPETIFILCFSPESYECSGVWSGFGNRSEVVENRDRFPAAVIDYPNYDKLRTLAGLLACPTFDDLPVPSRTFSG